MENIDKIGQLIKNARLSQNLTMEYVAKKANITRATLSSIENGSTKCSLQTLIDILNVLDLNLEINSINKTHNRNRATRTNTLLDKKINRFIIMCIEQYAHSQKKNSKNIYNKLRNKGIIDELKNDYEDLHGMSEISLNNYINNLL